MFLPAAGSRNEGSVGGVGESGYYWHSTAAHNDGAQYVYFDYDELYVTQSSSRYFGLSVRLVRQVK